ncbi:MAG: PEP-CTERM sorting domain-containing protein, partial [Desulfobaccales bacterium]
SIILTQHVTYDDTFKHVHVSMDILNNSLVDLHNVILGRGMDPDQDVQLFNDFRTFNVINGDGSVTATGPLTNLFVTMRNLTPDIAGVAAVSGPLGGVWQTDPYNLSAGGYLNGATGPLSLEDASINMTWLIGDLLHGVSKEIDFEYEFGQVPVPPTVFLLGSGLLALLGLRRRQKA